MTTIPKQLEELRDKIARKSMGMDCEERLLFDRAFNAAIQALSEGVGEFDEQHFRERYEIENGMQGCMQLQYLIRGARYIHSESAAVIGAAHAGQNAAIELCSKMEKERDAALAEVERLTDELECAERSLELKSKEIGRSEHCGNTVYYIYDKLGNYSRQLGEVAQERDTLRAECEKLRALQKDHDADWKRIQDAERECERLKSLVKALGGKI